ncbi:MAG: glucose 1-dehydrogenase [Rhodospirillales bacterium]|nr:glucose 1-dehydrogenase [Rhodospirillales bacterium]
MTISCNLEGKVIFVTGATSGFGQHFARTLAASGASVAMTGRRSERLEQLEAEIEGRDGRALGIVMDVMDSDSIKNAIEVAETELGPINVLVNNAGISRDNLAVNIPEEDYDAVLDTNLKGPFLLAQEIGRRMIERGKGGSIINVGSMVAYRAFRGLSTYAMSKAGMVAMTRSLALEWARYNINVNTICPGYVETEMNSEYFNSEKGKAVVAKFPGKALGKLEDLDGILLLLASDSSAFITGATIEVDGGQPL